MSLLKPYWHGMPREDEEQDEYLADVEACNHLGTLVPPTVSFAQKSISADTKPKTSDPVLDVINELRPLPKEHGTVIDAKGKRIWDKDGGHDFVALRSLEQKDLVGATFIHNHPSGVALSVDDIGSACALRLACVYAVGKTGFTYKCEPPKGQKTFTPEMWPAISKAGKVADAATREGFTKGLKSGALSTNDANISHWHAVLTAIAATTGIRYSRTGKGHYDLKQIKSAHHSHIPVYDKNGVSKGYPAPNQLKAEGDATFSILNEKQEEAHITKGESDGHAFRGNRYTGGISGEGSVHGFRSEMAMARINADERRTKGEQAIVERQRAANAALLQRQADEGKAERQRLYEADRARTAERQRLMDEQVREANARMAQAAVERAIRNGTAKTPEEALANQRQKETERAAERQRLIEAHHQKLEEQRAVVNARAESEKAYRLNPDPAKDAKLEETTRKIEQSLVKSPSGKEYKTEKLVVLDRDGKVLFETRGSRHAVAVNMNDIHKLQWGAVMTHNHPSNSPFSPADVNSSMKMNHGELRSTGKEWTYIMRPPKTGWPQADVRALAHSQHGAQIATSMLIGRNHVVDIAEQTKMQWDAVHQATAEWAAKYGIEYTRFKTYG